MYHIPTYLLNIPKPIEPTSNQATKQPSNQSKRTRLEQASKRESEKARALYLGRTETTVPCHYLLVYPVPLWLWMVSTDVQSSTLLYSTLLYSTLLYSTLLSSLSIYILYSTLLYSECTKQVPSRVE